MENKNNDTITSFTHLLQYAVRLLVDDLAAPGAVLQIFIAACRACLAIARDDAFI